MVVVALLLLALPVLREAGDQFQIADDARGVIQILAVAVGTFNEAMLAYMDYFVRKEYGDDYYTRAGDPADLSSRRRTIDKVVTDSFEQVVYSLNQPAAARGNHCVRADKTQLWTPDGFKYLHELKEGDLCYVWRNGQYEVEPIRHLNVYDFDGE